MYSNFVYYILDIVSETIIGSFFAKSEAMANKIMKGFDFKKANLDSSEIEVYRDPVKHQVFETFEEVKKNIGIKSNLFNFQQNLIEFEVSDGE